MIRLIAVSKEYPGGTRALRQVSLHLEPGSLSFLTGRSGAGKTTLLRLIALLERPTRGQIIVQGINLDRLRGRRIARYRRSIGVVFQEPHLLADRTVFENVALPLFIGGYRYGAIKKRTRTALEKVGLAHKERAYPTTLSSGEQQRVGIARAVVHRPRLLLADEPTGNLDPELSCEIMDLFLRFRQVGVTVVIATHDVAIVRQMRARPYVLREGRFVQGPAAWPA